MTKVKKEVIRVRLAPSPTGSLHIGTVRTALFNWLFAKHHTGEFILRIEDTDRERSKKEFEDDIISGLEWLGVKWDEFYRQSERTKYYTKYLVNLLEEGKAFWCYHTPEELENERQEQMNKKMEPKHACEFKRQAAGSEKREGIIRLKVDEESTRKIKFQDIVRGEIEFEERLQGDFSIAKNLETPLYNFANVIDDYKMNITYVIRGEDHISNVPKQILLQEALGFPSPKFAHLPLILGEDRSKLSKRHGATALAEYRAKGYLPDALVNFLALLGWTPSKTNREVLTKNEIIEEFLLEKVHKAGAVFDIKKLNWLNSQHLRMYNDFQMAKAIGPFVEKKFGKQDPELLEKMSSLLRERLEYLDQVAEFHYFFKEPEYDSGLLVWKEKTLAESLDSLRQVEKIIEEAGTDDKEKLKQKLDELSQKIGDRGLVFWPLRVALSGEKYSADPVNIANIIGKEKALKRIKKAVG